MIRLVICAFALAWTCWASHAQSTQLDYRGYVRGVETLSLTYAVSVADASYNIDASLKAVGLASLAIKVDSRYQSTGSINGMTLTPTSFQLDDHVQETQKKIVGEQVVVVGQNGQQRAYMRPPQTEGAVDMMAAIGQMLWQATHSGTCDGARIFYDGLDMAQLSMQTLGPEEIKQTRRQRAGGTALRCRITAESLTNRPLGISQVDVWMASLTNEGLLLPIQMTWWIKGQQATFHLRSISP